MQLENGSFVYTFTMGAVRKSNNCYKQAEAYIELKTKAAFKRSIFCTRGNLLQLLTILKFFSENNTDERENSIAL